MMIRADTKLKAHQRQNLFTQIKSSPKQTAKQESLFFFFWNNAIKSWLKPTFHSEFSSTPFVAMRGDNQGKMICSLYRKCAEVQWFDAEQQLCKQCNGWGSCSPASWIHPKPLFCCSAEKVTGNKDTHMLQRGDVSAGIRCLAHASRGASELCLKSSTAVSFLQGPTASVWTFPSVLGLLVSPGGKRWPAKYYLSNFTCLIPRGWQFQLNIL